MKVLIVEDEPKVKRALKKLMLAVAPEIEQFCEAANGADGLELLLTEKPDLLLLDMIMPIMTGVELLERIQKLQLDIPIIVVSGHHDFALVKQALQSGAIDYILKPFDRNDVEQAWQKAYAKIEENRQNDLTARLIEKMQSEQSETQLRTVLKKITVGHFSQRDLPLLPEFVKQEACVVHLLVICNYTEVLNERFNKDIMLLDYALSKCVAEFVELNEADLMLGASSHYDWCLWFVSRHPDEQLLRQLEQILLKVLKLHCFIWQDQQYRKLESYFSAISAMEDRVLYASLLPGKLPVIAQSPELAKAFGSFAEKAAHTIIHRLPFCIEADVEALFSYAIELEQLTVMHLFQAWSMMNMQAEAVTGSIHRPALDRADIFAQAIAFDMEQAKRLFIQTLNEYVELFRHIATAQGQVKDNRTLAVKEYIDFSYSETLSLANLAQRFFISKEYLASQFKQQYHTTVLQYIHQVRLEKAKQLLKESMMPVSAVAIATGYDHFSYFDKRFKGMYGVTPSEYRLHCHAGLKS